MLDIGVILGILREFYIFLYFLKKVVGISVVWVDIAIRKFYMGSQ